MPLDLSPMPPLARIPPTEPYIAAMDYCTDTSDLTVARIAYQHYRGTAVVLGDTGNLSADLQAAIHIATEGDVDLVPLTLGDLDQCIRRERRNARLQRPGRISNSVSLVLHAHYERLAAPALEGERPKTDSRIIIRWLIAARTSAGDAVFWHVDFLAPSPNGLRLCFATLSQADHFLAMLRQAADGPSVNAYDRVIEVPVGFIDD
jgi:hypothetical protein